MSKETLLAIDLGVSFAKAGLYDTKGICVASATAASPGEHHDRETFIQRGDAFLSTVIDVISSIVEQHPAESKNIAAISFSGQMGGAVGIDREWNDLTTFSSNMDARYTPYVQKMIDINGVGMASLSGTNYPYWGAKLFWWKNEFPDLYKRVYKFVFLTGYIIGRISDLPAENAGMDQTYLVMTGLADVLKHAWSDDLCRSFELDREKLPRIVNSATVLGQLNKEAAAQCGLKQGIPVVAGAGDKAAGALGAGLNSPGIIVDESASFAAFSMCTESFVPDTEHCTIEVIASPIPGLYYPTSFILGSGVTLSWFLKFVTDQEAPDRGEFEKLEKKMQKLPPGSDGLLAIGLMDGRAYPCDPDIRGMWIGHTWIHRQEHFYRALLESFAYEYKYFYKVFEALYATEIKEIRVIGGGAESETWNRIKCDCIGLPYTKLNRNDFALLGDILIGGRSVGIFDDLKTASSRFIEKTESYNPLKENFEKYNRFYNLYLDLLDKTRDIFTSLKTMS